jgi:XTP/dITP diphosphohydrolase
MMKILFATSNKNKIAEIRAALPQHISILSLSELTLDNKEVDEPYPTLEENAVHKARTYAAMTGIDCFSEDTGLEVDALNGEPGVKSARYAGEPADPQKNTELLLSRLGNTVERRARFRTVIALSLKGEIHRFEGICEGKIINKQRGNQGFGYDPVFIPEGVEKTFAEMTIDEKNQFSHRKKALAKMIFFLLNLDKKSSK